MDLSRVRPADLAAPAFGLAQEQEPEEKDKERLFERSELDKSLSSATLHLMVESPKWARFNEVCTPGASITFLAEGRLKIVTAGWPGTARVRSGFGCVNVTRCGDHDLTVVVVDRAIHQVQQDVQAVTCSSDPRSPPTLYQLECGGAHSGCVVYGPRHLAAAAEARLAEREANPDMPPQEGNPFPYTAGDG